MSSYILKDTKVLTISGYKPIQSVTSLDKVLESDGIFRHPKSLYSDNAKHIIYIVNTACNANTVSCTEDQMFLTRTALNKEAIWKPVCELTLHNYLGIVKNRFRIIPSFTFVENNTTHSIYIDRKEEWFMLGYYIAHGWIDSHDNEIAFIIHDKESLKIMRKVLSLQAEVPDCCFYKMFDKPQKDYKMYKCSNYTWYNILKTFQKKLKSHLVIEIPEWVHNAPIEYIREFIRGFEHNRLSGYIFMSSYVTALGIQRLYAKIGIVVAIYKNNINNSFIAYEDNSTKYIVDEDYIWYSINSIEEQEINDKDLYKLDTNKGFVVENIITRSTSQQSFEQ